MTADFKIAVSFSAESNDHQVRYILDGDDLIARLWGDMLGLDPDDVLMEPCPLRPGVAGGPVVVARCSCGYAGCGSEELVVQESGGLVRWLSSAGAPVLVVSTDDYNREVARALTDYTWETPERTAARVVKTRLDPRQIQERGFQLQWASGRVRPDRFTVSLRLRDGGVYQVLLSVPWRRVGLLRQPAAPDSVAEDLLAELRKPPEEWVEVEWSPMEQGLDAPKCAGRGWRPLTTRRS